MKVRNDIGLQQTMQRYLSRSNEMTAAKSGAIASGKRIGSAKDDASGLAIYMKMAMQATGISAASRNAQDAVSMLQTADDVLGGVGEITGRMNELAVRAGNGILGADERRMLQAEYDQLAQEVDRIGQSTRFNGQPLFDGSSYTMQVGESASDTMDVAMGEISASALGLDRVDLTTQEGAVKALETIRNAADRVSSQRGTYGAAENGLRHVLNGLGGREGNLLESASRLMDADIGKMSTEKSLSSVLGSASMAMMKNAQHLIQYNALSYLMK